MHHDVTGYVSYTVVYDATMPTHVKSTYDSIKRSPPSSGRSL